MDISLISFNIRESMEDQHVILYENTHQSNRERCPQVKAPLEQSEFNALRQHYFIFHIFFGHHYFIFHIFFPNAVSSTTKSYERYLNDYLRIKRSFSFPFDSTHSICSMNQFTASRSRMHDFWIKPDVKTTIERSR